MVIRKNLKKKYALISVYNKNTIGYLCKNLIKHKYFIVSTGSTCAKIKSLGFKCKDISSITKQKEILGGRIKTLNSTIYSSILFKRENVKQIKEFNKLKIPEFNLVIINLYPFKEYSKNNYDEEKIIEMIDVGGPSLLRAASKNYRYVTAISSTNDYQKLISNLDKNNGETDIIFRKKMAFKVFNTTSKYDEAVKNWLSNKINPENKRGVLRYGENSNQKAFLQTGNNKSIFKYQINGKQLSYNNIVDVDNGYKCLKEFKEPTCVIIKHTNPCGVASAKNINLAFDRAFSSDAKSAFGGIVLMNREIDKKLAIKISKKFFEIIVGPKYSSEAIKILKRKNNLIILKINLKVLNTRDYKQTLFGKLYQDYNSIKINKGFIKLVSSKKNNSKILEDLIFSLKVVKHMKSNAVVIATNKQTIGMGQGQTNRIDSIKLALKQIKGKAYSKKIVCASDGFFPFNDSLSLLNKNNCQIVAQPSGSINDKNSVRFAIKNKMSLYFTKSRLFKH